MFRSTSSSKTDRFFCIQYAALYAPSLRVPLRVNRDVILGAFRRSLLFFRTSSEDAVLFKLETRVIVLGDVTALFHLVAEVVRLVDVRPGLAVGAACDVRPVCAV